MRQQPSAAHRVVVTHHAVRRFAERADRIAEAPPAHLGDREAVAFLAERGYPVDEVRAILALHAEDAVRAGASSVRFDRVTLVLKGRSLVTCLPLR